MFINISFLRSNYTRSNITVKYYLFIKVFDHTNNKRQTVSYMLENWELLDKEAV